MDSLSHNLIENATPIEDEFSDKLDVAVHHMIAMLPISDPKLAEIWNSTADDQSMQVLTHVLQPGWPSRCKECPDNILDHWNHRDELMYANGMIFKVSSASMHNTVLARHECQHRRCKLQHVPVASKCKSKGNDQSPQQLPRSGISARHGKCQKLVNDNRHQYSSSEFSKFTDEWDFHHDIKPHLS